MAWVEVRQYERNACFLCGHPASQQPVYECPVPVQGLMPGDYQVRLLFCPYCNFAWQSPMPDADTLSRYYSHTQSSSGAVKSIDFASHSQQLRRVNLRLEEFFALQTCIGAPRKILDFGAGSPLSLMAIQEWFGSSARLDLCAVDPSPESRKSLRAAGIQAVGSLYGMSEKLFDIVLAFSVLEHVPDPVEILSQIGNICNGGEVWIVVPNSLAPRMSAGEFYGFEHIWHFTATSLTKLIRLAGLECAAIDTLADGSLVAIARPTSEAAGSRRAIVTPEISEGRLDAALASYARRRASLRIEIGSRVEEFVAVAARNRADSCAYIWGIGQHTEQLIGLFPQLQMAHGFIDSRVPTGSQQTFRNHSVVAPNDAPWEHIGAVLVSSEAFAEDIIAACVPRLKPSARLFSLYS